MIEQLYPCFRHWSDGCSVWIYSDPHFDDPDSKLMNPNWPDPDEQITNINSVVNKNDTLILLGDIGDFIYVNRLHGKQKILLTGNHDVKSCIYDGMFTEIYDGPLFIGDRILLSHEPISCASIYGLAPIVLNIHGHCHNTPQKYFEHGTAVLNVCSDVINFHPVNLKSLIKDGWLKNVENYHRATIDYASENSIKRG